ncbi:MAG: 30S ribosome-binding factor RbfA [Proteobacteria bacterium]|nr:30S ribosome-binding factor RbfA [Pseudomonadota bacterium]
MHSPDGPSQRQLRVGEMLRRSISDILVRGDLYDTDLANVSITVGEVRTSPDLKNATVFVYPLGGQNAKSVVAALNKCSGEVRYALTKNVALKHSPKIKFMLDTTFDQMDDTRRLLSQENVTRDLGDDEPEV